jgi:prepilin-type N-terminal cleavage/methylation domain-containing protein
MNSTLKSDFGPHRLPVRWLDSPVVGPLVICRRKVRRLPTVGTPRCGVRSSVQRPGPAFLGRSLRAFTLLELMVVIAIIGFIAALALPHVGGIGQANSMTTATRQLLDDVALARQRAMVNRSTVYMVFLPPMFWTNYGYFNSASQQQEAENVLSGTQMTNLMAHQYSAYALVSLATVGDQPGQHNPRYLTDWRFLPNGVFIAPFEFTMTNTFTNLTTTNTLSGITNVSVIQPWTRVAMPFPSLYPPNMTMNLPCIGFSPQGSLTTQFTNQYIALARGSIFYPTDTNGIPLLEAPNWAENPPGNDANNPNLIQIDWMTARATLLQNQLQ